MARRLLGRREHSGARSAQAIACLLATLSAVGCAHHSSPGASRAPAVKVCGQNVWNSPAGPVIETLPSADLSIRNVSSGGNIFLRLTDSCQIGASVQLPSADATIVAEAKAADGGMAFVVLHPVARDFTFEVADQHGSHKITVEL